jgi:hypothetical protein
MKRHGRHAAGKETLSIVLDTELKQELRAHAEANRRGLSDYVRIILEDAIQAAKKDANDDASKSLPTAILTDEGTERKSKS